jgi:hypothetical protein
MLPDFISVLPFYRSGNGAGQTRSVKTPFKVRKFQLTFSEEKKGKSPLILYRGYSIKIESFFRPSGPMVNMA